jgi:uncharacterized lipoprotein YmbA
MTEKLYYLDNKMSEFDAKVISCERDGEHYRIILDKTAFFPCEGGQYADTGTLGGVRVIDVREKDGVSIRVLDFDRWGEELSRGVTRVLCDALSAQGVSAVPLITGSQADAKLMLDLRRLDGQLGGEITLDVVWTIQKGKKVHRTGHVIRTTTCDDDIVSMVEAQSNLVQALAKDIARAIK